MPLTPRSRLLPVAVMVGVCGFDPALVVRISRWLLDVCGRAGSLSRAEDGCSGFDVVGEDEAGDGDDDLRLPSSRAPDSRDDDWPGECCLVLSIMSAAVKASVFLRLEDSCQAPAPAMPAFASGSLLDEDGDGGELLWPLAFA